jgi:2-hydroxychromene-2-carboxylate isomerase
VSPPADRQVKLGAMTQPLPSLGEIGRKALVHAATAVEQEDAAAAEKWLRVARAAGLDSTTATATEHKGETIAERRANRDRLLAVIGRRYERIAAQMQADAARP